MTHYADFLRPDQGQDARSIHIVDATGYDEWRAAQPERHRTAIEAQGFRPKPDTIATLPGDGPADWSVVAGVADRAVLGPWCLAKAAETLPPGAYRLAEGEAGAAQLGWLLGHYRFDRYRSMADARGDRILIVRDPGRSAEAVRLAEATALVRDMVNTPAEHMGPAEIEAQADALATRFGARIEVTRGDALAQGYPMIHAVGRAAGRAFAPRLIELEWGASDAPRLAIIGKGISFDSGGLDIKPSSGMRLMKKDMGGAAHALGLAQLVMASGLPVRLHLLIPAAENAISGRAFRPGDILATRKGSTVEIGNTDAEGRLVLGDALTRAGENDPGLVIDFATLTGAARVALGPDLPALFANDEALATDLESAARAVDDPLWRLPLWEGYGEMIKSDIADIANAGEGGFAGAITAALFLQGFVPEGTPWAHLDTFAWRPAARPGRPKGGDALGLRAAFAVLQGRYGR
jgi:leucyl aminopeptidase